MNLQKQSRSRCTFDTRTILAAGVMLGASLLAACGDSASATANKNASKASDDAARLAAGAGDPKALKTFTDRKLAVDPDPAVTKENFEKARNGLLGAPEKDGRFKGEGWKQVLQDVKVEDETKRAVDELKDAISILRKAANPELSEALKTTVQGQIGNTALVQAQIRLQTAGSRFSEMVATAATAQSIASRIQALETVATAIEKNVDTSALQKDQTDAKAAVTTAEGALADAKAALQKLQEDKAALERDAGTLEKKSEEQANASLAMPQKNAEQVKAVNDTRNASISTLNEALEKRKDAAELAARITDATVTVNLAQVQLDAAKSAETAVTAEVTGVGASRGSAASRVKEIREEIGKLVAGSGDKQKAPGLKMLVDEVRTLGDQVDDAVDKAAASADEAAAAFGLAAQAADANKRRVAAMLEEKRIADEDPLSSATRNPLYTEAPKVLEGFAHITSGEAKLIGVLTHRVRGQLAQRAEAAYKAAGDTAAVNLKTAAPAATKEADAAKPADDATAKIVDKFNKAVDSVKTVGTGSPAPKRATSWLALTVRAVAHQGIWLLNDQPAMHDRAVEFAKAARDLNPTLEFPGLLPPAAMATAAATPAVAPARKPDMGTDVPAVAPATTTAPSTVPAAPDATLPAAP